MITTFRADAIRVDSDERGFGLIIDTDEGDKLYVDIQSIVLDFYASVQREIRPYVLEAESARTEYAAMRPDVDTDGYALDDPKHPTYHDRLSAIHDNRERGI